MMNRTIRLVFFCPHFGSILLFDPSSGPPTRPAASATRPRAPVLLASGYTATDYNWEHRMPVACRVLVAASAS